MKEEKVKSTKKEVEKKNIKVNKAVNEIEEKKEFKDSDLMKKLNKAYVNISKGVNDTYKKVTKKTEEIIDQTKIKVQISSKEASIKELYTIIGEKTYKAFLDKTNTPKIQSDLKKIKKIRKEIDALNIEDAKDKNKDE